MNTTCPNCNQEYVVDKSNIGQQAQCSKCHTNFIIKNPNLMECPSCFKEISKQSKQCIHCGYALQQEPLQKSPLMVNSQARSQSAYSGNHQFTQTQCSGSGYINSNLMDDENVTYRAKLHWVIFLLPFVVIAILFLWWTFNPKKQFPYAQYLYLAIGIIGFILSFIRYKTSEFGVTNKRVLAKIGWVCRRTIEIFLTKVETIEIRQSVPGRIFGFGTVIVIGTGGTRETFVLIDSPLEFRKQIQEQVAQVQNR